MLLTSILVCLLQRSFLSVTICSRTVETVIPQNGVDIVSSGDSEVSIDSDVSGDSDVSSDGDVSGDSEMSVDRISTNCMSIMNHLERNFRFVPSLTVFPEV